MPPLLPLVVLLGVVEPEPLVPVEPDVPEVPLELDEEGDEVVLLVVPAPEPEEVVVSLVSVLLRVPGSREQAVRPRAIAARAEIAVIFSGLLFMDFP